MKRISLILILVLGLGLLSGCQAANNQVNNLPGNQTNNQGNNQIVIPPEEMPKDYFPLTVGSYWEYEGSGNEYATFTRKVLFSKDNLAQTTEDNGGTVATRIIETTDTMVKVIYMAGEDYQPKNLLETNFTRNTNDIILQAPLKVGTAWAGNNTNKQIIAVDATVETPAGKFENCIKVKYPGQNDNLYQYFKKGVGMVKQEFITTNNEIISSTLKKYEIK